MGDTWEGIVEWWLREQKIRHTAADLKEVLEEFTQKKLILEYKTGDTRVQYRNNRGKENFKSYSIGANNNTTGDGLTAERGANAPK